MNWILGRIEQLINYNPPHYSEEITALIHQSKNDYERLQKKYDRGLSLLKQVISIVRLNGYESTAKQIEEYIKENEKIN